MKKHAPRREGAGEAAGPPPSPPPAERLSTAGPELFETRVTENIEVAPGVFLLKYPRMHDFVPGQVVGISVDRRITPRSYSIASGRDEPFIDILYDVVPGGQLTPLLSDLQSGDLLLVSRATGGFVDVDGPAWWIAAGTGIAPFVSMAKSGLSDGRRLVHGSRTLAGFSFRKYFTNLLGERYICCCSQELAAWAYPGRLTTWLSEQTPPIDSRYLLCGSASMVVDVRDLLIAKGVPFERVIGEIYF